MHDYQNPLEKRTIGKSYGSKPIAIIVSTCSDNGFLDIDHAKLHKESVQKYLDLKYNVLNPGKEILYNRDSGLIMGSEGREIEISKLCKKFFINPDNKLTVIISSHGQLEDFLGKLPGRERDCMSKLSKALNRLDVKVGDVVLEACYSGLELETNTKLKSFSGESPARILSNAFYNQNITNVNVWGYPGKVSMNKVQYTEDKASVGNASDDIVGFNNGNVIKPVQKRNNHDVDVGHSDRRTERQQNELDAINSKKAKSFNAR